jgi:hypothetical protein
MRKAFFLAFSLASMIFAQGAMATDYGSAAGTPISSMVMVSFPDSSTTFQPPVDVAAVLDDARDRLDDLHQRPHQHEPAQRPR